MSNPLARWAWILWRAVRNFSADHGANHAAAAAYFSLLSFPPLILFAGRIVAWLLPHEVAGDQVIAAIAPFLPTEIASSLGDVTASLSMNGAILAVALPALFWVASHTFSALEIAVNVAYGTTPRRRFLLSRLKAFAGLFGGVIVLAGTAVASHVALLASRYYELTGAPPLFSPRERLVSGLGLLVVAFGVFTLFYKLLPRGKIAWSAAARAGVVAVILWEGARQIFGGIIRVSPAMGFFSGAVAGIVAVLAWIYVAVAVLIYGAEVAALLNGNRT
jgi:membrane protein